MKKRLVSILAAAVLIISGAVSSSVFSADMNSDTALSVLENQDDMEQGNAGCEELPSASESSGIEISEEPELNGNSDEEEEGIESSDTETGGEDIPVSDEETQDTVPPEEEIPDEEPDIPGQEIAEVFEENVQETAPSQEKQFSVHVYDDSREYTEIIFLSDLEKLQDGTLSEPDKSENAYRSESQENTSGEDIVNSVIPLDRVRAVLPEGEAELLTEDTYPLLKSQVHEYQEGTEVVFWVVSAEGYMVDKIEATGKDGIIDTVSYDDGMYEMIMPDCDVILKATVNKEEKEKEEINIQTDNTGILSSTSARSSISVQKVNADTKMNQDYAFTYAFREGVTVLKSISRYNGTLNTKLHNWFGDQNGFTTDYCNTFYGALIDDSSYSTPISVLYSNVGEYQGKIVDLKVTAVLWGTVSQDHVGLDGTRIYPCILFYKDRIAFNTISVGTVRFQFEFFQHNTDNKINPKGHVTMADLDGGQGFRVYDNWGVNGLYIRAGYDHLKAVSGTSPGGGSYLDLRGAEGTATTNSDPKGWCQVDFNGTFTVNWLAQSSWNTGRGPMNAFFISTSRSVGTYETNPSPEKRVGDSGSSFESMGRHGSEGDSYVISPGKNFDYVIAQRLLPGNYSKFEVRDTLDSCLSYQSAKVYTSGGQDVTKYFNISQTGNTVKFAAQAAFLSTDEAMNDVTYYFRINVAAKDAETIAGHNHFKSSVFYIKNNAERQIVSSVLNDTQVTEDTYVKGNITGSFAVSKTDAEDPEKNLTDAEFELYQWNEGKKEYEYLKKLIYNEVEKQYESGILTYTTDNLGKFQVIESKAPHGYEGEWKQDVNIASMTETAVYEVTNRKIKNSFGKISIVKKDSITGEIIEASDAEFKILQWNCMTGDYEDTLDVPHLSYNERDRCYVSEKLEITSDNEGRFRITETKNPTGYEGSFEEEIVFSSPEEQEKTIIAVNNPIPPKTGCITVTKRIKESDITWAHGNPVFRFRVTGTDENGRLHSYEDYVEYEKDHYTVDGGFAILSCFFENIPLGTYTVEELETLRYELENVSANTENVTINGDAASVLLNENYLQAGVTFNNKKTFYAGYSHTDVLRNKIPVAP